MKFPFPSASIVALLLIAGVPAVFAQSGSTVLDNVEADSVTEVQVEQEAGSGAVMESGVETEALIESENEQMVHTQNEETIDENCDAGSGNRVCFQESSPQSVTDVTQEIDANAENAVAIDQTGGSGSVQVADVFGTAYVSVTANQIVTTDTIIDIFQDCSMHTGVCVQRALPEVLTLATQLIAASALNSIEVTQESQSGALQQATVDVAAEVLVNAQQIVSPRTFLSLSQQCSLEVGMCIQRALPVIRTAVAQVIEASADNDVSITQDGALIQEAQAVVDAATTIRTQQLVDAQSTIGMMQQCAVGKGLCLHVDSSGNPFYMFSDGQSTQTGTYVGTLDETPLATDYSRGSVRLVASGICGGSATCSMVEQLLLWLFGPEEEAVSNSTVSGSESITRDTSSARRGHETNVLGASIRFLASKFGDDDLAPAAFGGELAVTDDMRAMICAMQKRLVVRERPEGVWTWTARELSGKTGLPADHIAAMLRDDELCPRQVAQLRPNPSIAFFPVAADGPVSSNRLWNKCIRGEHIGLTDIRANPDRTDDDLPRGCAEYRTGDSWYHPDLRIHFTWNRETGYLDLPEGYVPMLRAEL